MYLVRTQGSTKQPAITLNLGGVNVDFVRRHTAEYGVVMVGKFIGSERERLAVFRKAKLTGRFEILEDEPEYLGGAAPVPIKPKAADMVPAGLSPVMVLVLSNGWGLADVKGSGRDGDNGPGGGRAGSTGLTLGEMALTKAPPAWDGEGGGKYPWEYPGFVAPFEGWLPPVKEMAGRPSAAPEPDPGPELREPEAPAAPEPEAPAAPEPEAPAAPVDGEGEPTGNVNGPDALDALAEIPDIDAILSKVRELRSKAGGDFPSASKLDHHLARTKKADPNDPDNLVRLHKLTDDQYQAIKTVLTGA